METPTTTPTNCDIEGYTYAASMLGLAATITALYFGIKHGLHPKKKGKGK